MLVLAGCAYRAWISDASAQQPEVITVELVSGRTFRGTVDARTDAERLWLRYGTSTLTVTRPIDWDRVVRAYHNAREVAVEELPALAESIKSAPDAAADIVGPSPSDVPISAGDSVAADHPLAPETTIVPQRVESVHFDARLANWDGDVETDGLVLHVYPTAANGQVVPVNGLLTVDLTTRRGRSPHDMPRSGRQTAERIAEWTRVLASEDIGLSGAVVRLPFPRLHPELVPDTASHGLVHARLVVAGHGVFEESLDAVRIRPFAPLRDALERSGANRFLPWEQR